MKSNHVALGMDVGSLYLKLVLTDGDGEVGASAYVAHQGHPVRALKQVLPRFLDGAQMRLGITGALSAQVAPRLGIEPIDLVRAELEAVKKASSRA